LNKVKDSLGEFMNVANLVLDSPVFQWTAKDQIPEADHKNAEELRKYNREIQNLKKLAYALGVGRIVRAYRKASDDCAGEYFYSREFNRRQRFLSEWNLSPKQLSTIHRELRNDRDVILLEYDDPALIAHEIGHLINHRLGGLSSFERNNCEGPALAQLSRVTANMRRVARFNDYLLQNRDEFYAEAWSRFLCGGNRPTLFSYLSRPLRRLRVRHPEQAKLIETHVSVSRSN
jgi:hypothetical protein